MDIAIQDTNISFKVIDECIEAFNRLEYKPNTFGFINSEISYSKEITTPTVMFGGTLLLKLYNKGLLPDNYILFYDIEKFDQKNYSNNLGHLLLNHNAIYKKWGEIKDQQIYDKPVFIKPSLDMKMFNGMVITPALNKTFYSAVAEVSNIDCDLSDDTTVLINQDIIKVINEYRAFVINHKLKDVGQYVSNYRTQHSKLEDEKLKNDIIEFITSVQMIYQPYHSYVIDVCEIEDEEGFKIVEYNCLNISGMYHNDRSKIYRKIIEL